MPACCARQQFVFRYCSSAGPYRHTGWPRDRTMTDSVRSNIWFRPDKFPCAAHSRSEDRESRVFSYSGWWYSRRVLQTDPFPYPGRLSQPFRPVHSLPHHTYCGILSRILPPSSASDGCPQVKRMSCSVPFPRPGMRCLVARKAFAESLPLSSSRRERK